MKIGFDAKRAFHNTTGLGNYSRDLIRILSNYYKENQYYLFNPKPKTTTRLTVENNMVEVLPSKPIWKKLSSLWRQGPIVKNILKEDIELFHGLSGELPNTIYNKKVKTVVTIHDLIFVRYPELYKFIDRRIYFKKFKQAAQKADVIIAISEQTKNDIIEFLDISASKIKVVYQGCHSVFKEISTKPEQEELREEYNLPTDFILNVGTVEERKNVLSVIKAIKNIKSHIVIVGRKTKYYKEIEAYIEENELEKRVHFLEGLSIKELSILYQMATIFVYPSIFEGFGIPIIEALYSRTPVITSKGGVFPEAGGPDSIYVEPYNVEDLKVKIEELLASKDKRNEIADKGFSYVQKFNDEVIAKNIMEVYQSI